MKTKNHFFFVFLILTLFFACTEQEPVTPELNGLDVKTSDNPLNKVSTLETIGVMSRNVYVGTDVDVILSAEDPEQIPILTAQAFQMLIATNFPERAMALAAEVAQTQPHLIGLQEVALIRLQSPGDAVIGGTVPAETVFMDYLKIFMAALESYGLEYEIAGLIQNADVEMPMIVSQDPLAFDDIRLTDYDVVLVRKDVKILDVVASNYIAKLPIEDLNLLIPRGYVAVTTEIGGSKYLFVNTHLEPAWNEDALLIQLAQAKELMATLRRVPIPVILTGDFNSPAPNGETYKLITKRNKYLDVWTKNQWTDNPNGYTFGHDPDLRNTEQHFWERIEFIFVRNRVPFYRTMVLDPVYAMVVGDEPEDRTPSGLWPSDHGGVVAWLQIPTLDIFTP